MKNEGSAGHHLARALVVCAALALAGCGGDGGNCTANPAPSISSTPSVGATAGVEYRYFVNAQSNCLGILACTGVNGLQLPPGAVLHEPVVIWTPSATQVNTDFAFAVSTKADICGNRATQSWNVRVHPAPVIESFVASRTRIASGDSVMLTAAFQGSGRIEHLGPVTSGVPVPTPPLTSSTRFTLVVSNTIGAQQTESVLVELATPPAIHSFSALPPVVVAGGSSTLNWSATGQFDVARIDPPGIDVRGVTSFVVQPSATTTYTLHLANDLGMTANASAQVEVVATSPIESFEASASSTVLGGTVTLTARFQGTARLDKLVDGVQVGYRAAVTSGESVETEPLRRYSGYRLVVTDDSGRAFSQDLFVNVTGPGTFQAITAAPLSPARAGHAAVRLADGRILIVGGAGNDTTELFDTASGAFSAGPRLLKVHHSPSAVRLNDGRVLIVNTTDPPGDEIYDAATNSISSAPWGSPSTIGAAVLLNDGRVLAGSPVTVRIINAGATTRSGFIGSDFSGSACNGSLVLLPGGMVLGLTHGNVLSVLFSPSSNTFAFTGASVGQRGCGFTATVTGDGRVLLAGGSRYPNVAAETYDPATGRYSTLSASALLFRYLATGSTLVDGRVLLIGGTPGEGGSREPWAYLFDPATNAFEATGALRVARRSHTATVLGDGSVLVVGGCSSLPCPAEIYTP